ncbi:MAG: hypothetical protein CML46_12585 [Rhodobacteraceae bacterium]|nr:hypothetical protein [Paracoccaceae bacterium]MBR27764.1 hypothetical protein [Paracoccaceae bacterium]
MTDHSPRAQAAPQLEIPGDIVYVRELTAEEAAEMPSPIGVPTDRKLFAIHDAEGARLALTDDRKLAFVLARQHDKVPVSVH